MRKHPHRSIVACPFRSWLECAVVFAVSLAFSLSLSLPLSFPPQNQSATVDTSFFLLHAAPIQTNFQRFQTFRGNGGSKNRRVLYTKAYFVMSSLQANGAAAGSDGGSDAAERARAAAKDKDKESIDSALLLDNLEVNARQMADSLAYISGGLRVNLHAVRYVMLLHSAGGMLTCRMCAKNRDSNCFDVVFDLRVCVSLFIVVPLSHPPCPSSSCLPPSPPPCLHVSLVAACIRCVSFCTFCPSVNMPSAIVLRATVSSSACHCAYCSAGRSFRRYASSI